MKIKRYKDFNNLNEGLFWDPKDDELLRIMANKYNINYTKINDNQILLGPKNGHEIIVYLVNSKYKVKTSYYGSPFGDIEDVEDLDLYLKNYDFDSKPNIDHKYSSVV